MADYQTTHGLGCWSWGRKHYGCAVGMVDRLQAEVEQLQADLAESDEIRRKLGYLLTRTAAALKGEPPAGVWHSWHDLPEKAAETLKDAERYRALCDLLRRDPAAPWAFRELAAFRTTQWVPGFEQETLDRALDAVIAARGAEEAV